MNQLDDFLKRKLGEADPSERFEFREEFWLEAQRLIEADERRKRRRRWLFWWWFGLPLLLVSAIGFWVWQKEQGGVGLAKTGADEIQKPVPGGGFSKPGNDALGDSTSLQSTTYIKNEGAVVGVSEGAKNLNLKKQEAIGPKTGQPKSMAPKGGNVEDRLKNKSFASTQNSTANRAAAGHAPVSAAGPGLNFGLAKTGENPSPETPVSEKADLSKQSPSPKNGFENLSETKTPGGKIWLEILPFLPVEIPFLTLPKKEKQVPKVGTKTPVAADEKLTEPIDNQRFAFGANALFARHFEDRLESKNGFAGGAFVRRFFNEKWSVQAGANYRYRQSSAVNFEDSLDVSSVPFSLRQTYRFGWETTETYLQKMNLHRLEIPLSVARNFGGFELEAGLAPSFSLAVKARTSSFSAVQHGDSSSTTEDFWLKKPPVLKVSAAVFGGASVKVGNRLSVMGRVHWAWKNLRTDFVPAGNFPKNHAWLEAGLRWQFSPNIKNRK